MFVNQDRKSKEEINDFCQTEIEIERMILHIIKSML